MRLRRWMQNKIGQAAIVHLHSGETVQGYIMESGADFLVMCQAKVLDDSEAEVAGECVVTREQIKMMQVLRRTPAGM